MKTTLSILLSLAFGGLTGSAIAADSYYHRVPAQVKCPTAGCVPAAARVHPGDSGGNGTGNSGNPGSGDSGTPGGGTTPTAPAKAARLVLSTTSLNLGSANVGTSAPIQTVHVTNSGDADAAITGLSMVSGATDFGQSNNCGNALAVGASCDINIAFTPTARGARVGQVDILASGQSLGIDLAGQGLQAAGSITPTVGANFGDGVVGSSSSLTFTYTNTGDAPATGVYGAANNFNYILSSSCGRPALKKTIPVGGSCNMTVTYARPSAGVVNGAAVLHMDGETSVMSLALTGTAHDPATTLTPNTSSYDFGSVVIGKSAEYSFTLANTSTSKTASLTNVALGAGSNSDFTLSSTCGTSLAPGASCVATVRVVPTTRDGRYGSLTFQTDEKTYNVSISATGVMPEDFVNINTVTLDMTTQVGVPMTKTIVVSNRSASFSTPISVSRRPGIPQVTQTNNCGSELAPNTACTISVTYTPTTTDYAYDNIIITMSEEHAVFVDGKVQ